MDIPSVTDMEDEKPLCHQQLWRTDIYGVSIRAGWISLVSAAMEDRYP
jgi:hypothetical protein